MTGSKKDSPMGTKDQPCGDRFMIREKSHCTIFTIDSSNQESAQNSAMGWFLESIVKMVQWDFSLIINRDPRGWAFVPTGLYFLLPVMSINLEVLVDELFERNDFCADYWFLEPMVKIV